MASGTGAGAAAADGEAPGRGRLITGVAWAALLLALWLWGKGGGAGPAGLSDPATGDVAAVGRPLGARLPPPLAPVEGAVPERVAIPSIGVGAPVVPRGLDQDGAVDPPPYERPGTVGWYGSGTRPGAAGAALLVGHVDTTTEPAVFYGLSSVRPGARVEVGGADGSVREFTVDDVRVFARDEFEPEKVYGPRAAGRAELRLITCGGTFDRAAGHYTANVVVSAYLTGTRPAPSGR
ncbi:class F sortase [Streptomyces sp. LP05-1]|uniref:Class F sortase n=1 Tax=Streptomyces pyxinae TaxID=2970734 RepID=A0ABT2CB31_9ACTN|nr:class F sortase [Streptomyces sp. LP05-1]MCS0634625.1 class F sortase [Streptomyces sp. LP05-1]